MIDQMSMCDTYLTTIPKTPTVSQSIHHVFVDIMLIRIIFNRSSYVDLYFYKFWDNSKGALKNRYEDEFLGKHRIDQMTKWTELTHMGDREAAKIANRISLLMIICLVILVFLV